MRDDSHLSAYGAFEIPIINGAVHSDLALIENGADLRREHDPDATFFRLSRDVIHGAEGYKQRRLRIYLVQAQVVQVVLSYDLRLKCQCIENTR